MTIRFTVSETRVLIVDDHELLREGLKELLADLAEVVVCGESSGEDEAMKLVVSLRPALVLVDVKLAQGDGISLLRRIKSHDDSIHVIVISMFDEKLYGERALRVGASGYVHKQAPARHVLAAVDQVLRGGTYISPELSKLLSHSASSDPQDDTVGIAGLANRELQVFRLIGQGLMTNEIADRLNVSPRTIDTYRERLKTKLKLRTAGALNRRAMQWSLKNE